MFKAKNHPVALVLLASLVTFVGCKSSPPPSAPKAAEPDHDPHIYTTDEVSGDLTIINARTFANVATIHLGKRPRGIHPSPDHKFLYIALSGTPIAGPGVDESTLPPPDRSADGIGIFDVATNKIVRMLPGGADPENFDVSQDGKYIYVSNEDTSAVSIIDIQAGAVTKSFPVGAQPEGVKISPDGKLVYITSEDAGKLFVLDPAKGKIVGSFTVGHRPRSIAIMPDGKKAYVNAENDGDVVIVDMAKLKQTGKIQLGKPGEVKPMAVLLSQDSKTLYTSTGRGQTVFAIDTATDKPLYSVVVGKRPWGIALSSDGRTLYSANGPSNDISAVDLATHTVVHKAPAGGGPWGIVVLDPPANQ